MVGVRGVTSQQLAEVIMQCQDLRKAVKYSLLKEIDNQCKQLCTRSAKNSSVLRAP